jgi:glycosyltransferase 2 family protein
MYNKEYRNVLASLRGKIIVSVLIGLVVVIVLGLISDVREVGQSFGSFAWSTIPAILGFTLLNYVLRWLKWDYYLRRMGMHRGVDRGDSALLFTSGMVMAVTPGKVGEVLKSYLLKHINGTPISASAPIVLAERVTDGLAMLLLMGFGLTLYAPARPAFFLLLLLAIAGLVALQFRPLMERLLSIVARLPRGDKIAPRLMAAYVSSRALLSWRILLASTAISLVSWFGECVAFYFVLRGLGEPPGYLLLLQATFIFAASTLFGLVSFLPGGLGVSEASSAGLLVLIVGMAGGPATTATIIIRFCTLWFGVTLGALALAIFGRRYGETTDDRRPTTDDRRPTTDDALPEHASASSELIEKL